MTQTDTTTRGAPTTGPDPGVAEEIADRVVRLVQSAAAGAEAEVTVSLGTNALTRFANSFIHQNVAEETSHVVVRVAIDGRVAYARLDGPTGDEALRRLVAGALESARVRPVDPDWPGLAPVAAAPPVEHWDDATAAASPDERAAIVEAFVRSGDGLETAGSCATTAHVVSFANTAGQRLVGRFTLAELDGIARTPTSDGSGRHTSVALGEIDGAATGGIAATKAREGEDPTDLEPGRYEVVLEPRCVADILQFLFVYGFSGRPVAEGRSFVHLGETQFDASIDMRDDVTDPATWGLPFDVEGTPKGRVDVVKEGVTSAILQTRRTGAKLASPSTGNAIEDADLWGALPNNPVLGAGEVPAAELVAGMGRGILVTDFWYTRILDPKTQVVTGLTRNGVWLVEDGRVVRPVRNFRFTQSYLEALGPGAVRAISRERALIPAGFDGIYLVPSLHLGSWNFTGGARG